LIAGDNRLPALLSRQHGRCIPHCRSPRL
jgi:hypothetical protein